ncbi:hypothetical protein GGI07_001354 [Coemansia sp. Benny D115]|nr:hypothetical protein GGI07_001354 [Coemansia sp. Benny D115]
MPLDAHFTCPAALKRQFAVMEAFDIEGFLASQAYTLRGDKNRDDELVAVVGFMDVSVEELPCCRVCQKTYPMSFVPSEKHICQCGARNSVVFHGSDDDMHGSSNGCVSGPCGFWSSLAQAFSAFGGGSSSASKKSHGSEGNCKKQRVLAVVAGSSLIFYHADARDNAKHRVMCRVELEDACFAFKDSERTGIVGSSVGVTVEIDLGLADVAKMWLSILVNRVDAIERQKRSRIERAIATADTDNVSAIRLVPI